MKRTGSDSPPYSIWGIEPEIDQHEVRFSEYIKRTPKRHKSLDTRRCLPTGIDIECEIDDEGDEPHYKAFTLSLPESDEDSIYLGNEKNILKKPKNKSDLKIPKKKKEELSLNYIFQVIREIKSSSLTKYIKDSKQEIIKIHKDPPNKLSLGSAKPLLKVMFNPNQKHLMIHTVRKVLGIPAKAYSDFLILHQVVVPEVALIVFKKKFRFKTKKNALEKLACLELLEPDFYENRLKNYAYAFH